MRKSLSLLSALALCVAAGHASPPRSIDWPVYGGNAAAEHYSELTQIDRTNVSRLQPAWRFETGAGGLQTSPLVIGRTLFAYTPAQKVIALDAATGKLQWTFDPGSASQQPARGLTYWTDGKTRRLFAGAGSHLYSLDPTTGQAVKTFGDQGRIDLRADLGRDPQTLAVFPTSPGIVYHDMIIIGFRTSETQPAAPGAVRAYDVRTGRLRWIFHLIPRPGQAGHETWPADAWKKAGGANVWGGFALDEKRGIVYVPTGSAVDDFYGADRAGDNLFANSLVALNAATGKRLWHFQAVHHDLWDRDFPSQPVLLTVTHEGKRVDAVAQASKQGFVYLFDRVTGKPLFPIEERPVPQSDVPGEHTSRTQPFPHKPAPYARQELTPDMATTRTPQAHAAAVEELKTFRNAGLFAPPALGQQTVAFPSFDGGAEWGGMAVDRSSGVAFVNAIDIVSLGGLAEPARDDGPGATLYARTCAACHGLAREGSPPEFPRLADVATRLTSAQIAEVVRNGRGRMPGFPIGAAELNDLLTYLKTPPREPMPGADREVKSAAPSGDRPPYLFTGYRKWFDAEGYPAVKPPWGTLNAIDLNTGEYLWKIPLGEYPALAAQGLRDTGTENYGGPVVTASGLLFIGATIFDRKFRAFDSRTGAKLWETELPFAGAATPITYMIDGRQYVVIACSGSRDPAGPQGSAYVAFALPASPVASGLAPVPKKASSLVASKSAPHSALPPAPREDWVTLFNGRDLTGWTPKITHHDLGDNFANTFRVEDGLLKVRYDGYEQFDTQFGHLFYQTPYSHYRLVVEYRFVGEQAPGGPGAWALRNSGAMLHSQDPRTMQRDQNFPASIEAQFLGGLSDGKPRPTLNMCSPGTDVVYQGGSYPQHCLDSSSRTYDGDQWVRVEMEVMGGESITHYVDGQKVLTYSAPQFSADAATVYGLPGVTQGQPLSSGYISLQSESHPIDFRKVELLNLAGCMDPMALNYKRYYVKSVPTDCIAK